MKAWFSMAWLSAPKLSMLGAAACVTALLMTAAYADQVPPTHQVHEKHHHPKPEKMLKRMAKVLELSDSQQDQLRQHYKARYEGHKVHRGEMQKLRKAMRTAVSEGQSEEDVSKIAQQIGDLVAEKAMARYRHYQALTDILDPYQLEKMKELRKHRSEHFMLKREAHWNSQRSRKHGHVPLDEV